jgi:hypothetical protein
MQIRCLAEPAKSKRVIFTHFAIGRLQLDCLQGSVPIIF